MPPATPNHTELGGHCIGGGGTMGSFSLIFSVVTVCGFAVAKLEPENQGIYNKQLSLTYFVIRLFVVLSRLRNRLDGLQRSSIMAVGHLRRSSICVGGHLTREVVIRQPVRIIFRDTRSGFCFLFGLFRLPSRL